MFWAGTAVGYRQAQFSFHWNENYARQFDGPSSPLMIFSHESQEAAQNSHGAFGEVLAVRLPIIVVKGGDEPEKEVVIGSSTIVRSFRNATSSASLAVGDQVVVIGRPNDNGQIEASLIRIIPGAPPGAPASTTLLVR